ncbi:hypothetical protein L5515_001617 [Caenorhabditis briggsae]|uniref:Uncharacterized protein n=1 Tax=Caenorhabditis briggsae TaxID=6238 RepID=A0AAE9E362_CAEBR|nr:hypothetical protein L5515_001617 [Caenorhabditis briggsae]
MNSNERSKYLCDQYGEALGEQLKPNSSQYVLADLNKNTSKDNAKIVQKIDSEYILRDLQNQANKDEVYSRDAPNRPFLTGTPVNAKEIRSRIESLDNVIVVPQIINGKVYFTTHGDADARTAVEGSTSNPNLNEGNASGPKQEGIDITKVKFTFGQLVTLLGPETCQRLEREFAKNNKLSDAEMNQLRTARESVSELALGTARSTESTRTAQSVEPNLLSTRTANSLEPNLLSVYSARSPGIFTKNDGILTAQSPEPNLLSVRSAKDLTAMSPGVLTAQVLEPNLLSTRTARSTESTRTAQSVEPNLLSTRTANSLEPNLLSVYSARSPGIFTKNDGILTAQSPESNLLSVRSAKDLTATSPGVLTAQILEPNLLSTRTARSTSNTDHQESKDVLTAVEIQSPTIGVLTARSIATPSSSNHSTITAQEIESIRSSKDVLTAVEILTDMSRSSQDVRTAVEIPDNAGSQMTI